jgi:alpha-tubulin suppressor-like RCC1 family protein
VLLKFLFYFSNGQLGDGTNVQRNTPVAVLSTGSPVTQADGGMTFSLLVAGGKVYTFGLNNQGQLVI